MKNNTKKRKWIIIGSVVLAVTVGSFTFLSAMGSDVSTPANYTAIYSGELVDNISVKGTVESVQKSNVYSTVSGTVKTVNVEVGDKVTEGQVLCELDTEDLKLNIAQQKADLDASEQSNLNQLENNKRIYDEALGNIKNGANSQILSAESSFKTAEANLKNAQKSYDDALKDYQDGIDPQSSSTESNLASARLDMNTKKTTYENNKILLASGAISNNEYTQSETAYISAVNKYNDTLTSLEKTLEQAENSLNTAKINYDNAVASKNAAQTSSKQDLEKYQSNVESSQIAVNNDSKLISIQKLEKELEDSSIKAPISGTVTAVYAKEGSSGSGLLFVIEDTENLKITTKIKEYDVGRLKTGMEVTIKSDSTGSAVYDGVVSKIEPAAIKNTNGNTASESDVEFGAEIEVTSADTALKIGMNTRLNIIVEKKDDVYCVPYDAVSDGRNGESFVYAAVSDGKDSYTAKQIAVTTGMETDFYVEIISGELTDGMKIINDASKIRDGAKVSLK